MSRSLEQPSSKASLEGEFRNIQVPLSVQPSIVMRMFLRAFRRVFWVGVLGVSGLAVAQVNRYETMEMASVMLIGGQKVQTELKLSTNQTKTVKSAFREYADRAQTLMQGYQKDRKNYDKYNLPLRAAQKKLISSCLTALSAAQTKRLREIGIWHYGIFSVTQADVAKQIGMNASQLQQAKKNYMTYWNTMDQVSRLRASQIRAVPQPKNVNDKAAVAAYQKKVQELARLSREVDAKKILDVQKAMEKKTEAMLSKVQRDRFQALKGRPFSVN